MKKRGSDNYSVMSHARAYKISAAMSMKTTIEPKRTVTSFMKCLALIFGIFVALYTIAMAATSGSSHSIEYGVTPIRSGTIKVAMMETNKDISDSHWLGSTQICPIHRVDDAQKV